MPSFIATGNTGGGGRIEPGIHKFEVVEATERISTNGNPVIVLTLENSDGDRIKDNLVFTTKAFWKIEAFLVSAGKKKPEKGENISLSTRDCLEFEVAAKIRPQKDKPEYCEVERYLTAEEFRNYIAKVIKGPDADDFDEIPF